MYQKIFSSDYETVAASQTDQIMGPADATSRRYIQQLSAITIVPESLSPGAVSIKDGDGSAITIFQGGVDSITTLHPWTIPLNLKSKNGPWKITTGANVSVIASGDFEPT